MAEIEDIKYARSEIEDAFNDGAITQLAYEILIAILQDYENLLKKKINDG